MKLRKNKKIYLLLLAIFLFTFISLNNIKAEEPTYLDPYESGVFLAIIATLGHLTNWIFAFLVIGSVIAILIGSFMVVTSGGDNSKLSTGKKTIIIALIALLIGSFARAIIEWAQNLFQFP